MTDITPPTVQVTATYPGASARVVADTIALPIEQQVNGVEDMLYMQSTSASDGTYKLIVTFKVGTNLDMAQVLVQNRVATAVPQLPLDVQKQGAVTKKVSTAILQVINLYSPEQRYDSLFLSNYAWINLRDVLARLPGVGDVVVFGEGQYSMRVWLDPEMLKTLGLDPSDVVSAIQKQNLQVPAGQLGMPPALCSLRLPKRYLFAASASVMREITFPPTRGGASRSPSTSLRTMSRCALSIAET